MSALTTTKNAAERAVEPLERRLRPFYRFLFRAGRRFSRHAGPDGHDMASGPVMSNQVSVLRVAWTSAPPSRDRFDDPAANPTLRTALRARGRVGRGQPPVPPSPTPPRASPGPTSWARSSPASSARRSWRWQAAAEVFLLAMREPGRQAPHRWRPSLPGFSDFGIRHYLAQYTSFLNPARRRPRRTPDILLAGDIHRSYVAHSTLHALVQVVASPISLVYDYNWLTRRNRPVPHRGVTKTTPGCTPASPRSTCAACSPSDCTSTSAAGPSPPPEPRSSSLDRQLPGLDNSNPFDTTIAAGRGDLLSHPRVLTSPAARLPGAPTPLLQRSPSASSLLGDHE